MLSGGGGRSLRLRSSLRVSPRSATAWARSSKARNTQSSQSSGKLNRSGKLVRWSPSTSTSVSGSVAKGGVQEQTKLRALLPHVSRERVDVRGKRGVPLKADLAAPLAPVLLLVHMAIEILSQARERRSRILGGVGRLAQSAGRPLKCSDLGLPFLRVPQRASFPARGPSAQLLGLPNCGPGFYGSRWRSTTALGTAPALLPHSLWLTFYVIG